MKKHVKIILAIVAAMAIAGAGGYTALRPLELETVAVGFSTATLTFTEQGTYQYAEQIRITLATYVLPRLLARI